MIEVNGGTVLISFHDKIETVTFNYIHNSMEEQAIKHTVMLIKTTVSTSLTQIAEKLEVDLNAVQQLLQMPILLSLTERTDLKGTVPKSFLAFLVIV